MKNLRKILLLLVVQLSVLIPFTNAQGIDISQLVEKISCEEYVPPVFSRPTPPTLCEKYGQIDFVTHIGKGTNFEKSSDIGANLSGNISILGDFIIDKPFSFTDALVKISPDVIIQMQGSFGNIGLSIINSKLFACEKMWQGIEMDDNTSIITRSSTVEDARKVINCIDKSYVIFDLESTIFNRNTNDIHIQNSISSTHSPFFKNFQSNTFSCTSPLNDKTPTTLIGIYALDYGLILPFNKSAASTNTFKGIANGIVLDDNSYLIASNLLFDDIIRSGIYSREGRIELKNCNFLNYLDVGVVAKKMQNMTFDNCTFTINDNLKSPSFTTGIRVDGNAKFGSSFSFTNSKFVTKYNKDFKIAHSNIILNTPVVEAGTEIFINNSNFSATSNLPFTLSPIIHGIVINGNYPVDSKISIFKNTFSVNVIGSGHFFLQMMNGNKENAYIVGNTILGSQEINKKILGESFILDGSDGKNNFFAENKTENLGFGFAMSNFRNTLFCSNRNTTINQKGNYMFSTTGENDNTKLIANKAINTSFIGISSESYIGDQIHNGNEMYNYDCFDLFTFDKVTNLNNDINFLKMSKFEVHTPQSTSDCSFDPNANPFYPELIAPVADDVWWFTKSGTPKSNCLVGLTGTEDSETNRFIASGSYRKTVNNDALAWQAERTLYFNLLNDNELIGKNPLYAAFIQKMEKTNIPFLYEVSASIRNARKISDISVSNLKTINKNISDKIELLEKLDNDLIGDISVEDAEAIILKKKATIEEIKKEQKKLLALQNELNNQMFAKLNGVTEANKSIATSNILEINEQVFNHYFIKVLRGEELSELEGDELENIAFQCPKDGGMAVYYSRSLIDYCIEKEITDFYDGCYSKPKLVKHIVAPTEQGSYSKIQKNTINELFPNPANEFLNAKFDSNEEGIIVITNLLGKEVLRQRIKTGDTVNIHGLGDGVYHAKIVVNGNNIVSKKIIVTKN
jgi:hypothetical protein